MWSNSKFKSHKLTKKKTLQPNMPFVSTSSLQKAKKEFVPSADWKCDANFDEVRHALGKSFCGTPQVDGEPNVTWIVGSTVNQKLAEQSTSYVNSKEGLYTFIMSYVTNQAFRENGFILNKMTADQQIGATVLLVEIKQQGCFRKLREAWNDTFLILRLALRGGIPKIVQEKTPEDKQLARPILARADHMLALMSQWHKEYAPHSHWYVKALGTNPDCQGQGFGSAMMRRMNEMADAHQRDLYLECGEEKNKNFYQKFGYQVVGANLVEDPTGTEKPVQVYCMLRPYQRN
jgi:ribosomal protein S18 acetylase RimI-like enzyme